MASAEVAQTQAQKTTKGQQVTEVLPRQGLVYSEKSGLVEVLCKPKIMAVKATSIKAREEETAAHIAAINATSASLLSVHSRQSDIRAASANVQCSEHRSQPPQSASMRPTTATASARSQAEQYTALF